MHPPFFTDGRSRTPHSNGRLCERTRSASSRAAALLAFEDDTGVLWRKLWGYRGMTIGAWTAVEVANGTFAADSAAFASAFGEVVAVVLIHANA
jgi:hypothetical protein